MLDNEIEYATTLLIDGSHMDRLRSTLGISLDIKGLTSFLSVDGKAARTLYYRDSRDINEYHRLKRLFAWLDRHGIERRGVDDFKEPWYRRERYGSNLVALAFDAMDAAHRGDSLVFVCGDPKLIPLFKRLEEMDVSVTLVSSRSAPDVIAPPPPLIDLAEEFIDFYADRRFVYSD